MSANLFDLLDKLEEERELLEDERSVLDRRQCRVEKQIESLREVLNVRERPVHGPPRTVSSKEVNDALELYKGNVTKVAHMLRVSRYTVWRRRDKVAE